MRKRSGPKIQWFTPCGNKVRKFTKVQRKFLMSIDYSEHEIRVLASLTPEVIRELQRDLNETKDPYEAWCKRRLL